MTNFKLKQSFHKMVFHLLAPRAARPQSFDVDTRELRELEELSDFLYLHDNQLSALPPSLSRLNRLRYLNLSENAFETLAECFTEMSGLIELRATDNPLVRLPDSIRGSALKQLSSSLTSLPRLEKLDLRWIPLEPPAWFANLENRGCAIYR